MKEKKIAVKYPTEDKEQMKVIKWSLEEENIEKYPELPLLNSSANGVRVNMGLAMKLKRLGLKKGFPDLNLPIKRPLQGYHGLYIELKRVKGSKTYPEQIWWLERLTEQGYYAVICKGADEAIQTIIDYLEGKL